MLDNGRCSMLNRAAEGSLCEAGPSGYGPRGVNTAICTGSVRIMQVRLLPRSRGYAALKLSLSSFEAL
jgi:hypothetical protein